jgi:D-alanine-D-alanine ligase
MDFRLDSDLTPKIIDVNPLPGLSPAYSDLVIMCRLCGVEYGTLVGKIVKAALTRCGFTLPR